MGSNRISYLIPVMVMAMAMIPFVQGQSRNSSYNRDSLDSFIHDNALTMVKRTRMIRTGILYNLSLPANYSGINASVIRLRTGNLWRRGTNLSFFGIQPGVLPQPYSQRIFFVIQNLGNQSDLYYNVQNYTFVTPVIGLLAYNANTSVNNSRNIELNVMKDHPILVNFSQFSGVVPYSRNATAKCVRFGTDGGVEFSNLTAMNKCAAFGLGHFSVVIPSSPPMPSQASKNRERIWKWWAIGFGVGIGGLILVVVLGNLLFNLVAAKKIGKMEKQSEKGEALDTIWVGSSRMPSASGIRTQPVIEHSYLP